MLTILIILFTADIEVNKRMPGKYTKLGVVFRSYHDH